MTNTFSNTELAISFANADKNAAPHMRIQLGDADLLMPLPDGLTFTGKAPLNLSLSIPNQFVAMQEEYYASTSPQTSHEETHDTEEAPKEACTPQLLLPPAAPQKTVSKYQTQWPVVGGNDLLMDTSDILKSEAFRKKYQPGIKRDIYIAGCPGLKDLKKQLSIPIFKIGDCGEGRIAERIKQQSKDQYGSYYKINGDWPVQDEGFDDYSALQIYLPVSHHQMSPVRASSRGLTVTLPEGMTRQQFSRAFQKRLASCSWLEWRKTEDALAHFERKNINQDVIDRYTDYGAGETTDIAQATELYCIRNEVEEDCKRLIAVIENITLEHMGLL